MQFDYAASDGSVTVKQGETLVLLDKSNAEWWKLETPTGRQGTVPRSWSWLSLYAVDNNLITGGFVEVLARSPHGLLAVSSYAAARTST